MYLRLLRSACLQPILSDCLVTSHFTELPCAFLTEQTQWSQTPNFGLSGKVLISASLLKDSFARYRILSWQFFLFWNFKDISLLASKISYEKSSNYFIEAPLYMMVNFSLAAFNIPSLSLSFEFDYNMSCCGSPSLWFVSLGIHWASWILIFIYFIIFGACSVILKSTFESL